jgi:hypothetical protein
MSSWALWKRIEKLKSDRKGEQAAKTNTRAGLPAIVCYRRLTNTTVGVQNVREA